MSFTARTAFPLPSVTRSYFLGHHSSALKSIQSLLTHIDLVLECRDFRVPLSSFNPLLETALRGKPRGVLLTKTDLCSKSDEPKVIKAVKDLGLVGGAGGGEVITTKKPDARTATKVLKFATSVAKDVDSIVGARMLVVGMPNVGKSTLLNALRRAGVNKGKSERTGAQPGITRKIGTSVKIHNDPDIYVIDTPGVFVPYVANPETMVKLALVGCVKDTLLPPSLVVDYLLYRINLIDPTIYKEYSEPTNDVMEFLKGVATRIGRLQKGGEPELESTALWILQRYRVGQLGNFLLDDISPEGIQDWVAEMESEVLSDSATRRKAKADRVAAVKDRWRKKKAGESGIVSA